MPSQTSINRIIVAAGFAAGVACRYALRDQVTGDTAQYLLPWYDHARAHGVAGLGESFTNYTPFYSYLLLAVTKLDGLMSPWYLIKSISFVFELGCAAMAARLIALGSERVYAAAVAFAAIWLAPTVLFNGAAWGQADAIWTFFILLSVYWLCRGRPGAGVIAFGVSFAIKAQAVFLGPFIFALALRRKIHWAWLAAVPAVYLVLAAPAWLLGMPLRDIVTVYFKQAETFARFSMNIANVWLFVPNEYYGPAAVGIGLAIAAVAGLVYAIAVARVRAPLGVVLMVALAAISLQLMPMILPKMHDRYFYAFELFAIVLACLVPRLTIVAFAAQLNGVLAYLTYYGLAAQWLRLAAIGNIWILVALILFASRKARDPETPDAQAFSPWIFAGGMAAFWVTGGLLM